MSCPHRRGGPVSSSQKDAQSQEGKSRRRSFWALWPNTRGRAWDVWRGPVAGRSRSPERKTPGRLSGRPGVVRFGQNHNTTKLEPCQVGLDKLFTLVYDSPEVDRMDWLESATVAETLTTGQVARLADVTREYVARLCRDGRLDCAKVGGRWLILDVSVDRWLRSERKPGRPPGGARQRTEQLPLDVDHD